MRFAAIDGQVDPFQNLFALYGDVQVGDLQRVSHVHSRDPAKAKSQKAKKPWTVPRPSDRRVCRQPVIF
jgi:hypothetical protein